MLKTDIKNKVIHMLDEIPYGSYSDVVFFVRRSDDRKVWGLLESNTAFLADFLVDLAAEHPEFDEALMESICAAQQREEEELRKEGLL